MELGDFLFYISRVKIKLVFLYKLRIYLLR